MLTTLRGQQVDITEKTISLTIRKPRGRAFSISDKLYLMLKDGYNLKVQLPNNIQRLNSNSRPFKKETVPSKFFGLDPWYRYWFVIEPKGKQFELSLDK